MLDDPVHGVLNKKVVGKSVSNRLTKIFFIEYKQNQGGGEVCRVCNCYTWMPKLKFS